VRGTFDPVVRHFAFDDPGSGAQPSDGQQFVGDLSDGVVERGREVSGGGAQPCADGAACGSQAAVKEIRSGSRSWSSATVDISARIA